MRAAGQPEKAENDGKEKQGGKGPSKQEGSTSIAASGRLSEGNDPRSRSMLAAGIGWQGKAAWTGKPCKRREGRAAF